MGSFSDFWENEILDHVFGKGSYTPPTIYVGLSTADPTDDGTGLAEPPGNGYARVATAAADWNAASGGAMSNANPITFPQATGPWGTITHFAIFDAASAGNMLAHGRLGKVRTTLAENLDDIDTTITLTDASSLPSSGTVVIDNEDITYAGKTGNDLTGCTRGANGTTATAHANGVNVFEPLPKAIGDGDTPSYAAGDLGVSLD